MAEVARVVFRKQVSDGNYGTEAAEVTLDVAGDGVSNVVHVDDIEEMLKTARLLVHEELKRSPSGNVRRALEYPQHEREERWKQAEASAEIELAAGLRDNARGDDPEHLEDLPF